MVCLYRLCDEISLVVCALKFVLCYRFVQYHIAQSHILLVELRQDIPGLENIKLVILTGNH